LEIKKKKGGDCVDYFTKRSVIQRISPFVYTLLFLTFVTFGELWNIVREGIHKTAIDKKLSAEELTTLLNNNSKVMLTFSAIIFLFLIIWFVISKLDERKV